MAAQGEFIVAPGEAGHRYFVPRGSDLRIEEGSVSSEWTTESEDNKPANTGFSGGGQPSTSSGRVKRRIRNWRMKYIPPAKSATVNDARSSGSSSSSGSVRRGSKGSSTSSSDTSSGSSSSDGGEVARQKRQRKQLLKEWEEQQKGIRDGLGNVIKNGESNGGYPQAQLSPPPAAPSPPPPVAQPPYTPIPPADEPPWCRVKTSADESSKKESVPRPLQWYSSQKDYRSFAIAPAFLSTEDIQAIHLAAKNSSVKEINDRKGYLAFKHRVWRFELQLRALQPELYRRLLALMRQADTSKWNRMRAKKKKLYPEIEYIEYDVAFEGSPCFIEPHVDNKSAVTMVAMLSAPWEFTGGRSCFRRASGRRGHREVGMQQGDIVLFRGEKLVHWITPVTSGRRIILQIELSRV